MFEKNIWSKLGVLFDLKKNAQQITPYHLFEILYIFFSRQNGNECSIMENFYEFFFQRSGNFRVIYKRTKESTHDFIKIDFSTDVESTGQ